MLASALHSIAVGNLLPAAREHGLRGHDGVGAGEAVATAAPCRPSASSPTSASSWSGWRPSCARRMNRPAGGFVDGAVRRPPSCPARRAPLDRPGAADGGGGAAALRRLRAHRAHRRRRPRAPRRLPLRRRHEVGRPLHRARARPSATTTTGSASSRWTDDEEALLAINHEYVSLAYLGDAALYPADLRACCAGRAPTVDDFKRDVGRLRACACGATAPPGPGCPCSSDPLNRRINALTPCRVDGPAAPLIGADARRGHLRQLRGADHAVEHRPHLRGELPGPRARGGGRAGAASRAAARSTCPAATTAGWSRSTPTIRAPRR